MNLQWFMDNTYSKTIIVESVDTQGNIGIKVELAIKNAETHSSLWGGCELTINDGEVSLYFDKYERCVDCKDVLTLYRKGNIMTYIYLLEEDSWTDEYTTGYVQY